MKVKMLKPLATFEVGEIVEFCENKALRLIGSGVAMSQVSVAKPKAAAKKKSKGAK